MKILKGIGYCIAVILFCFGIGVCCAHQSMRHVFNAPAIHAAIDKLVDTTVNYGAKSLYSYLPESIQEELPPTKELIKMLPAEVQNKLEDTKVAIAEDEQINTMLSKYSEAVIAKIDDDSVVLPNIQEDVKALIETKLPLVANAIGVEFTQPEVSRFAQEISTDINLQPVIEEGIQEARENLSPQEAKLLSLTSLVQSKKSLWIASFCFGLCAILVIWLKKSILKTLPFVGVLCILGGGLIFAGATAAKMLLDADIAMLADGVITSLNDTSVLFILSGIGFLVVYFVLKIFSHMFGKKQQEVNV